MKSYAGYTQHDIHCTFYTPDTLRKLLSKPKDEIPKDKECNVVYRIPCADCNAVYIGETKRTLIQRTREHARAVSNGDVDKNEIADHCWENNHRFDWERKAIIDRELNSVSRKIKETIHSISDTNHINSISYGLPDIWLPALNRKSYGSHRPKLAPKSHANLHNFQVLDSPGASDL